MTVEQAVLFFLKLLLEFSNSRGVLSKRQHRIRAIYATYWHANAGHIGHQKERQYARTRKIHFRNNTCEQKNTEVLRGVWCSPIICEINNYVRVREHSKNIVPYFFCKLSWCPADKFQKFFLYSINKYFFQGTHLFISDQPGKCSALSKQLVCGKEHESPTQSLVSSKFQECYYESSVSKLQDTKSFDLL